MGNLRALRADTSSGEKKEVTCSMCGLRHKDGEHTVETCRNRLHQQLQNERRSHEQTKTELYAFANALEPLMERINNLPLHEDRA